MCVCVGNPVTAWLSKMTAGAVRLQRVDHGSCCAAWGFQAAEALRQDWPRVQIARVTHSLGTGPNPGRDAGTKMLKPAVSAAPWTPGPRQGGREADIQRHDL